MLYEATTGRAAFDPDDEDMAPPAPVRRLRRLRRGRPAALAALIEACLRPRPSRRPTIDRALRALEPLAGLAPRERRFSRSR